ncbi:MAG: 3-phosphoshikimate 1-carboxyvinyltransferase [Sphingosinicella sp.]|nr:3-phosphoshikimate 1-carboxyvinyltransferase [Sphingosinicella sp.]
MKDATCSQPEYLSSRAGGALRGEIEAPGDKSMSHRALILGGLAEGETHIFNLLEGRDVLDTAGALRAFGIEVDLDGPGHWRVTGAAWKSPPEPVDCGNSGTAARLLIGAASGFPICAEFTGDASLRKRPMDRLFAPLRSMGARIDARDGDRLPARVEGGGLGGIHFLNATASAQVKSAILLAGLRADGEVEVKEPARSRDHSENMLRDFGCDLQVEEGSIRLGAKRKLKAASVQIPGDPSSAAFPLVAALITPGSELLVRSVMVNPLRAGLYTTLREMGADLAFENRRSESGEEIADIRARFGRLRGVEVPASRAPSMIDEYPILGVAAAYAEGRTVMRGISELRVKESDRIAAMTAGLRACGVAVHEEGEDLVIEGLGRAPAGGAIVAAQGDHRIAMSFLMLGLASRAPVKVDSAAMIATSFPGFAELMHSIGAEIEDAAA